MESRDARPGEIVPKAQRSQPFSDMWPGPWPWIWRTFIGLQEKLLTVPPRMRLAVVDWWLGQLLIIRSEIEAHKFPVRERWARKTGK